MSTPNTYFVPILLFRSIPDAYGLLLKPNRLSGFRRLPGGFHQRQHSPYLQNLYKEFFLSPVSADIIFNLVSADEPVAFKPSSIPAHTRPMEAVKLFTKWNRTKIDCSMLHTLGIQEMEKKQYAQMSTGQKGGCISPLR